MRPAKIAAETAYFRLTTVGAVCEDWMVGVMGIELVTPAMFAAQNYDQNVFPPWQSATRLQRLRPGTKRSCLIVLDAASR
jgi:hypothetical protein